MEVEVVMPIVDGMGMEVVCPPVVTPGEFFVCTADIPQGSDLIFNLVMKDDLQPAMTTDSGWLNAPEQFLHIPGKTKLYYRTLLTHVTSGGALKTKSYNLTLEPDDMKSGSTKAYIIQSTYFGYSTNLTGIFYVPDAAGDILFEVSQAMK